MDGDFSYSFLAGVLAAVNPCGFVLLPTYLLYFLGLDSDGQRASLVRALRVSAAVSTGFVAVFLAVGAVTRLFTSAIQDNAKFVSFGLGFVFAGGGVAMLAGWRPVFMTPHVSVERDDTTRGMFLYGVAYAVASIGCTLPLLTTVVLGSFGRDGFVSGTVSVGLYGLGMAMFVSVLTVSMALARSGLVAVSRSALRHVHSVSAVLVTLTGLYLIVYWWGPVTGSLESNAAVDAVEGWQSRLATFLNDLGGTTIAVVLGIVLFLTVAFIDLGRSRRH